MLLELYKSKRTVFTLADVAMLMPDTDTRWLAQKVNYYVRKGELLNPRKGIYAKSGYSPEELACKLYTPSYISLEYVLQRAGVIFQYDSSYTCVSYLSREIESDNRLYRYRKIKGEIMIDTSGIIRDKNNVNIATPERALLDMMYLNKDYYFDNINPLDRQLIEKILPIYGSATLEKRVAKLLSND